MLKFKKKNLVFTGFLILSFWFSYFLLSYYEYGDQLLYKEFYNELNEVKFNNVMSLAKGIVSSYEPISAYILWLGSKFNIEKNLYISLLNLILLGGLFLLLQKYNSNWFIYLLIFSNFYLFFLLTSGERLKIAYIFIVYSVLIKGKLGKILIISSPFAHIQSFIIMISYFSSQIIQFFIDLFSQLKIRKNILYSSILLIFIIPAFYLLREGLIYKLPFYFEISRSIVEVQSIILLIIISVMSSKNQLKMFYTLIPYLFATYFLGGQRVNMIGFSIAFYYLLLENRLKKPLFLIVLIYLSIKTIPFIKNIFKNGDGFDGWLF